MFGGGRICNHLLVHCWWVSLLWYLSLSTGGQLGSTFQCERCDSGLEEQDEKELGSWSLEYDSLGYLVGHLKGEKSTYLEDKALSFQDFKLYFSRLLLGWSVGLIGDKFVNFMRFVDCIMDESLTACCFCMCPFCTWVIPPGVLFLYILITYQKKKEIFFHKMPIFFASVSHPKFLAILCSCYSKPSLQLWTPGFKIMHVFPQLCFAASQLRLGFCIPRLCKTHTFVVGGVIVDAYGSINFQLW